MAFISSVHSGFSNLVSTLFPSLGSHCRVSAVRLIEQFRHCTHMYLSYSEVLIRTISFANERKSNSSGSTVNGSAKYD